MANFAPEADYYQIGKTLKSWAYQESLPNAPEYLQALSVAPVNEQKQIMDYRLPDRWGAFKRLDGAQRYANAAQQLLYMVAESQRASMANDVIDGLEVVVAKHKSFVYLDRYIRSMHTNTIHPYHFTMPYGYAMDCDPYFYLTRHEIVPHVSERIVGMTIEYIYGAQLEDGFVFPAPNKPVGDIVPWDPYAIFSSK